jgi:hypothetical protein
MTGLYGKRRVRCLNDLCSDSDNFNWWKLPEYQLHFGSKSIDLTSWPVTFKRRKPLETTVAFKIAFKIDRTSCVDIDCLIAPSSNLMNFQFSLLIILNGGKAQPLESIATDWLSRSGEEKLNCTLPGVSELWCSILDFQSFVSTTVSFESFKILINELRIGFFIIPFSSYTV